MMDEMDEREYIEKRFEDQRKYYDKKALQYQKRWIRLNIITVLLAPIPMVILSFVSIPLWARLVLVSASYLATVLSSLLSLLKYRELWITYRSTEQEMLREYYHYKTGTKAYEEINDQQERFKLFVTRIEEIMAQERSKWLDLIQQQDITTKHHS